MKTSRPPEFTPEEWKMMSKYYTKEEKAEVKGGGKRKEEDPKSKESEISAPAEARTLQMPSGKRIRAVQLGIAEEHIEDQEPNGWEALG